MKLIPQKCIRYSLMACVSYFIFEKYNIKYNLENCFLAILSCLVLNRFFKKIEGFEDEEHDEEQSEIDEQDQEEQPDIDEEIQDIIEIEEEPTAEQVEEEQVEEPAQEEQAQEEPAQEEPAQEEPAEEEPAQEEETEIKPYSSDELQKLQKKYTIMPVDSWIKNEISLMQESQKKNQSCACPTLSRASNDYLEF